MLLGCRTCADERERTDMSPADGETRWQADDAREGRPVVSLVWAQPGGDRLLVETTYAGSQFEPLSFADARFEPKSGRLVSFRAYGEAGRGWIPILSVQRAD